MTDEVIDPSAEVPPVDLTAVAFLRSDAPGSTPMPTQVWDRLAASLAAEAAARPAPAAQAASSPAPAPETATVIPLSRARSSRPMRWAGGLVAAGVVVVAGAAVIPGVIGGTAIVANDPSSSVLAEGGARASTPSTAVDGADGQDGAAALEAAEAAPMAAAEAPSPAADSPSPGTPVEPAAKIVLASNTVYAPTTLRAQVVDLVRAHFTSADQAVAAAPEDALPAMAGFTQSWAALRDCLTRLTQSPDATALVVDRGTYEGVPAGVIVAPDTGVDYAMAAQGASPSAAPTETVLTADGLFDVWVVDQECEQPSMTTLDNIALFAR